MCQISSLSVGYMKTGERENWICSPSIAWLRESPFPPSGVLPCYCLRGAKRGSPVLPPAGAPILVASDGRRGLGGGGNRRLFAVWCRLGPSRARVWCPGDGGESAASSSLRNKSPRSRPRLGGAYSGAGEGSVGEEVAASEGVTMPVFLPDLVVSFVGVLRRRSIQVWCGGRRVYAEGCLLGLGRPSLAVLPATRAVPWLEELGVRPRPICFTGSFLLRLVSKLSSDGVPSASGAPVVFFCCCPRLLRRKTTAVATNGGHRKCKSS